MRGVDETWTPPISLAARRRQRVPARSPIAPQRLLLRAARALHEPADLPDTLGELAEIALEAGGADRCGVFLVERDRLVPTVARVVPGAERGRFRSLGAIELADHPHCRSLLADGRVVGVLDARVDQAVPAVWTEELDLHSVVLVPMLVGREPVGVFGLAFPGPHLIDDDERDVLEALAAQAGLAVRAARLVETDARRARVQDVLGGCLDGAGPAEVARHVVTAATAVVGAAASAVVLFDGRLTSTTLLAADGADLPTVLPLPAPVRERLAAEWTEAGRPLWFDRDGWPASVAGAAPAGARWLVVPAGEPGRPRAALLLAVQGFEPDEYDAARLLARTLAVALDRAALEQQVDGERRRVGVLAGLDGELSRAGSSAGLLDRLRELLAGDGIEPVGLALRDRRLAARLGGDVAPPAGARAVPMRAGRRLVGHLYVLPDELDAGALAYVEALGRAVADVALRGSARADVEEAARSRAIAAQREMLTGDLHDVVGQIFVAIGLHAHRAADELPSDSPWAERIRRLADIARDGKWAVDHSDRALAHVPAARRGLPAALRGLGRAVERDSGITVAVTVAGRATTLPVPAEQALYRVAHEALAHAWRRAGCAIIAVTLEYGDDAAVLRIRDDGVRLDLRADDAAVGVGPAAMRRAVAEVGGSVRIVDAKPRGVLVEARVARGQR